MGNYQISFQDIPNNSIDPAPFNKFQIRLLKRAIDVYIGVGLPRVWNVINSLNALVGAAPVPRHPFADWSFREILQVSAFQADPTTGKFSLYSLAKFINNTLPIDTGRAAPTTSFQQLLSPTLVTVPAVTGLSPIVANAALTAAGLAVDTSFIAVKGDVSEVIRQSPLGATVCPCGP